MEAHSLLIFLFGKKYGCVHKYHYMCVFIVNILTVISIRVCNKHI